MSKDRILADLVALAHNNPLYAWRALVEECRPGAPLPDWLETYLREVGNAFLGLAEQESPSVAAKKVAATLGFTGVGWNGFRDYRAAERDARAAVGYEVARRGIPGRVPGKMAKQIIGDKDPQRSKKYRQIVRAKERWASQK